MGKWRKYIIELAEDPTEIKLMKLKNGESGLPCMEFETVTPYEEPDLDAIRKEAYQKGYCDALAKHCAICEEKKDAEEAYQRGLNDAWDAARKIERMTNREIKECFRVEPEFKQWVCCQFTAEEVIERIRQYEQKKEEKEIKAGDEVYYDDENNRRIVILIYEGSDCGVPIKYALQLTKDSKKWCISRVKSLHKTGRSFPDVVTALQKWMEEENV